VSRATGAPPSTEARAEPTPRRRLTTDALAAIGSGLLLSCAFAPLDWGLLALVALVPLLWCWHDAGPARGALTGFLAGVAFFAVHLWWSVYFGAVAIVPLVLVQAAYWAAAGAIVGALGRFRVRGPWIVAAAWVLLEALRVRWPLGGFAWGQVGIALHDFGFARALASWGGVALASFVVVAVNGLVLDLGLARWSRRAGRTTAGAPRAAALAGAGLAAVVLVVAVATVARLEPERTGDIRFALLQGNDQNRRLTAEEIASGYLTRRHLDLASRLRGPYDLIVFPESALETDPEVDVLLKQDLLALARRHRAAVMVNVIDEQTPGRRYNANRLYAPNGRLVGTYAKQHLVPFGEYVPWRDQLGFVEELNQVPVDFDAGDETVVLDVAGHPIGTVICFESAFSPLVRDAVRDGAEAIVVSTNNRSYRRSPNSQQHVDLSQMTAAAVGRPVLHSSISGITAVITADGDVVRTTDLFRRAVVTGRIDTVTGDTLYVRLGDWVVAASVLVLLGGVALAVARRRIERPERSSDTAP
jgi:apolipoprotein N-acyltransferase